MWYFFGFQCVKLPCNDTGLYAYQKDPDGSGTQKCGVEIAAVHIYCVTGNERFFVKIFGCIKNGIVLLSHL